MCRADFLLLSSEFAAIQFRFSRLEVVDEFKSLSDVVEVGHVDDDLRGDAVLRDEERTSGFGVAVEAIRHGLAECGESHHVIRKAHCFHGSLKHWHLKSSYVMG